MDGTKPYIHFDRVEVSYSEEVTGLRDVSLDVAKGEFVFLCGQTGCGKSTLIKVLTRQVRYNKGTVILGGRDLSTVHDHEVPLLRREMGIVPQDFGLLPNKNVWENVGYALRAVGKSRREARRAVPEILERVNILHRADAYPSQLSGGEQQRVAIGRALINNPPLLLADEPTANLDPSHSREIMELLQQLNTRGTTVLVASHDMPIVEQYGKRIIRMEFGRIVEDERSGDFAPIEDWREQSEPEPTSSAPTEEDWMTQEHPSDEMEEESNA